MKFTQSLAGQALDIFIIGRIAAPPDITVGIRPNMLVLVEVPKYGFLTKTMLLQWTVIYMIQFINLPGNCKMNNVQKKIGI